MFSLVARRAGPARERLVRAMRECDRFIPGISRCAVGTNAAGPPIELVWETTYQSVGAYATTYMTHPYHAVAARPVPAARLPRAHHHRELASGAGLIGYPVERDRPLGPVAVRRLLLLDFDDADSDARPWPTRSPATDDGWSESILAENTMATRWFDGETDLGGRGRW